MRISDWSSDVCSSDLPLNYALGLARAARAAGATIHEQSPALEIVRTNGKPGVRTPKGSVRADYLVLACNGHLGNLEPRIAPAITIGRALCRERVCQYVSIAVVAGSLKKTKKKEGTRLKKTK